MADEASAWWALKSAAYDADSAAASLDLDTTDENYLGAIGDMLDLSIQYLEGIVNGGKQRDVNIESLLDSAFITMDGALQADEAAAGSFLSAFGDLEIAGAALELGDFQPAEDAADLAAAELLNTQDSLDLYSTDLLQLDSENTSLSAAIQNWLSGGP